MRNVNIDIQLYEVENGFVIGMTHPERGPGYPAKRWIAKDMPEVLEVIGKLYLTEKEKE